MNSPRHGAEVIPLPGVRVDRESDGSAVLTVRLPPATAAALDAQAARLNVPRAGLAALLIEGALILIGDLGIAEVAALIKRGLIKEGAPR